MKKIFYLFCLVGISLSSPAQDFKVAYDHTALRVSDLNQSAEFYREILLLEEIKVPYENPIIRWFSLGDPYQLHLIQMTDLKVQSDIASHLALYVDDLDAFVKHLKEKGIPYRDWVGNPSQIALRPDSIQQVYIQDPDGHWIEINDSKH